MKIYKVYKDRSNINKNIYLTKGKLGRVKNRSTFNIKKILKDRELKYKPILCDIVYYSGFSNNIKEAKHNILTSNIKVNNIIINEPNYKLKSGDIVSCINNKVLLEYYNNRWNTIKINNIMKGKDITYKKYKFMYNTKNIHRISYNSILFM